MTNKVMEEGELPIRLGVGEGVYKGKHFEVYHEFADGFQLYVDFGDKMYSLLELLEAKEKEENEK